MVSRFRLMATGGQTRPGIRPPELPNLASASAADSAHGIASAIARSALDGPAPKLLANPDPEDDLSAPHGRPLHHHE